MPGKKKKEPKYKKLDKRLEAEGYPEDYKGLTGAGLEKENIPKSVEEISEHVSDFFELRGQDKDLLNRFINFKLFPALTDKETTELVGLLTKQKDIPEEHKDYINRIYESWMKLKSKEPETGKEEKKKPEEKPEFVPGTNPSLSLRLAHRYIDEFEDVTGWKASSIPDSPEELASHLRTILDDDNLPGKASIDSFIHNLLPMMRDEEIEKMIQSLPDKHKKRVLEIIKLKRQRESEYL